MVNYYTKILCTLANFGGTNPSKRGRDVVTSSEFSVVAGGAQAVPEPSTLAMLLRSFAGLGCAGFQRSKGPSSVRLTDLRINKTNGGLWQPFIRGRLRSGRGRAAFICQCS
jgi:hypothetical protein